MRVEETRIFLRQRNIPNDWYSLDDDDVQDGQTVLRKNGHFWTVYTCADGDRLDVYNFVSEEVACDELLRRVLIRHKEARKLRHTPDDTSIDDERRR